LKISLNWLKNYIDLNDISVDEIVDKLSYAGLEVEEVIDQSKQFENIIVGFVKERTKHPNADKLSVCIVTDGESDFNVVCGAPNVAANQKIAFAKVGAIIPNGQFKIEKAKIRGEVSFGMICSERELGISDNHEGILVLDESLKVGTLLSDALGFNDVLIEVAITPNRADALSHIGIARDLSALFKRELILPQIKLEESKDKSDSAAVIEIIDLDRCPRYVGKVVKNVSVKESPEWLKIRLKNIGLRPINNIVDVTNFVLHEVGQPLHAFDLDKLNSKKIVVKCAANGEKFITLDSKERVLKNSDLMICDGEKAVAIAGVMGGENSEVTVDTTNILIESAFFNPSSVRKTAKHLALSTDASYRFERGADYNICVWAAQRTAQLIQETGGGEILSGEIDIYPSPIKVRMTSFRFSRVEKILGYSVPQEEIKNILLRLGFKFVGSDEKSYTLEIPSYRHDIEREIDVIEEIARIYGYNNIPEINKIPITLEEKVDQSSFGDNLRNIFTSLGFYEIVTNSLLEQEICSVFAKPIALMNPQNSEMSHLRTSLIPGMLRTIQNNLKVNEKDLRLFEIGKVFFSKSGERIESFDDFNEEEQILLAITGNVVRTSWASPDIQFNIYDLKGYIESSLSKLIKNKSLRFSIADNYKFLESQFEIMADDKQIGFGGVISTALLKKFDINQPVFVFIAHTSNIRENIVAKHGFDELLKFPKVVRDLAFVVDSNLDAGSVEAIIWKASSNLLHNIKLFDIFQSESLGIGKKSLAFQLEYFDSSKTLTEEEVDKDFRSAIKAVEKQLNAQLRGI
jgi:phenylalanyl-tRNA synthetase beta chain